MGGDDAGVTLGAAIRTARGRVTQQELANRLDISQSRISKWEQNTHRPSLEEIRNVEDVLSRPRGFVLIRAGYVDLPQTLEEVLAVDARFDDADRDVIGFTIQGVLQRKLPASRPQLQRRRPARG